MFDHEKLDVYRLSIEFIARAHRIAEGITARPRASVVKHLDEASSSIALNI